MKMSRQETKAFARVKTFGIANIIIRFLYNIAYSHYNEMDRKKQQPELVK